MELHKDFLEKYNDLMNEDVELALEFTLKALDESKNPDFYAYLADCYMSLEEYDEAIALLNKGLNSGCTNITYSKSLLGEALFYLGKYNESKTIFEDLKDENPNSFFITAYLMDININLQKYNDALEIGNTILSSNTLDNNDTAYILVNLGWINLKYLINLKEAINYFNKAIEIDSNLGTSYIGLGEYYYKVGEYNKALINYEKAIDLQEGTIDVYFGIAMCYKALEQYDDALVYLNIVHDADNTNERYIKEIEEIEKL